MLIIRVGMRDARALHFFADFSRCLERERKGEKIKQTRRSRVKDSSEQRGEELDRMPMSSLEVAQSLS